MLRLAVIPQAFAMVGDHDDRGAVVATSSAQSGEDLSDDLVHGRDLAVIEIDSRTDPPRRRPVGRVRFVQMDPQKEGLRGADLIEP